MVTEINKELYEAIIEGEKLVVLEQPHTLIQTVYKYEDDTLNTFIVYELLHEDGIKFYLNNNYLSLKDKYNVFTDTIRDMYDSATNTFYDEMVSKVDLYPKGRFDAMLDAAVNKKMHEADKAQADFMQMHRDYVESVSKKIDDLNKENTRLVNLLNECKAGISNKPTTNANDIRPKNTTIKNTSNDNSISKYLNDFNKPLSIGSFISTLGLGKSSTIFSTSYVTDKIKRYNFNIVKRYDGKFYITTVVDDTVLDKVIVINNTDFEPAQLIDLLIETFKLNINTYSLNNIVRNLKSYLLEYTSGNISYTYSILLYSDTESYLLHLSKDEVEVAKTNKRYTETIMSKFKLNDATYHKSVILDFTPLYRVLSPVINKNIMFLLYSDVNLTKVAKYINNRHNAYYIISDSTKFLQPEHKSLDDLLEIDRGVSNVEYKILSRMKDMYSNSTGKTIKNPKVRKLMTLNYRIMKKDGFEDFVFKMVDIGANKVTITKENKGIPKIGVTTNIMLAEREFKSIVLRIMDNCNIPNSKINEILNILYTYRTGKPEDIVNIFMVNNKVIVNRMVITAGYLNNNISFTTISNASVTRFNILLGKEFTFKELVESLILEFKRVYNSCKACSYSVTRAMVDDILTNIKPSDKINYSLIEQIYNEQL